MKFSSSIVLLGALFSAASVGAVPAQTVESPNLAAVDANTLFARDALKAVSLF
jgi:hypothetical protein